MYNLQKVEVFLNFGLWIFGVSVSLYHVYLAGQSFDHRDHDQYHYEDFKRGWKFLGGRFQDQSDSEWNTWTNLFIKLTPFLLINFLGAETIRHFKKHFYLPIWYTCISVIFFLCNFTYYIIFWLITQTLIYYVLIYIKSYILLWITSYIVIHYIRLEYWLMDNEDDQYLIMVCASWMVLRCISFTSDKLIDKKRKQSVINEIVIFLSYTFYLPTLFCGPFMTFFCFNDGIQAKNQKWNFDRAFSIFWKFWKCIFWYFFTLFTLHFIYVNAILLRPYLVKHLEDWELAGLGIAMGHFFHLKYIVFYGLPCAWASAEGFDTPKLPCCVSRVHLYSYMWRRFDHGLYQFLIKYIYIPVLSIIKGKEIFRKTVASVLCFLFVFVWHGQHDYVFFWVVFNFIAITIELAAKDITNVPYIQNFLISNFSPDNLLRLQCLLIAPLHCFSMISNYFFIGNGTEIGFIYFSRIIYGSLRSKLLVLLFLYGAGQSSTALQKWERQK